MSSKLTVEIDSFFPARPAGVQGTLPSTQMRGSGFYIGENIVLTAFHNLYDVRYTNVDANGDYQGLYLQIANQFGIMRNGSVTPITLANSSRFLDYVNSKFATFDNPYLSSG